jgi:hypothetical protein
MVTWTSFGGGERIEEGRAREEAERGSVPDPRKRKFGDI